MHKPNAVQCECSLTQSSVPNYKEIAPTITQLTPLEAISILEPFIEDTPHVAEAHNDLAVFYFRCGEIDKAERFYTKAVELEPYNTIFLKNLADFYFVEKKELEKAMRVYLRVLKLDPEDVEALNAVGLINLAVGHNVDAQAFFEKVKILDPEYANHNYTQDQLVQGQGETATLLDSAELNTEYAAELKMVEGHEAWNFISAFVAKHPTFAVAHNDLGVLHSQNGRPDDALIYYREAVRLAPHNTLFRKNLADLHYIVKADPAAAMRHYNEVLKQDPNDTEVLFAIGRICVETGDGDTATDMFAAILSIEPNHAEARARLDQVRSSVNMSTLADQGGASKSGGVNQAPIPNPSDRFTEDPSIEPLADRLSSAIANSAIYIHYTGDAEGLALSLQSLQENSCGCPVFVVSEKVDAEMLEIIDGHGFPAVYLRVFGRGESTLMEVMNAEISYNNYEFYAILTSGVQVNSNWFTLLMESLLTVPAGAIAAPLFTPSTHGPDAGGISFDAAFLERRCRHRRLPMNQVDGACTVISADAQKIVGPFDESLETFQFSITDWVLRARIEGLPIVVAGDVAVEKRDIDAGSPKNLKKLRQKWHQVSASSKTGRIMQALSTLEQVESLYSAGDIHGLIDIVSSLKTSDMELPTHRAAILSILIDLRQFEPAADLADRFQSHTGDAALVALCGYIQEGLGNIDTAATYAQKALAIDSGCALALNLRGLLAAHSSDLDSAESFFRSAINVDPGYGEPYANLATLLWNDLEPGEAFDLYEKAFSLSPTSGDLIELYQKAVDCYEHFERAAELVSEALTHYPSHRLLTYFHIDLALRMGDDHEAIHLVQAAIRRYGVDDGILKPALKVRERLGPISNLTSPQDGVSLSVCLIVKDEEACIADCLNSVQGLADEIVIVDTGSTDNTVDIATVFGAKLRAVSWQNDFSAARNTYLEKARGDWILVLDADEVVSFLDHDKIRALIGSVGQDRTAYTITTRNYESNPTIIGWTPNNGEYGEEERGNGWIPTHKVRLFPNDPGLRYTFPVHELLEPSLKDNGYQLVSAQVPIHHYGKLNLEKTEHKRTIYYELGLKKLAETGENPYALRELAIQAGLIQRYDEAISLWKRLIHQKPGLPEAYINMGTAYYHLGDLQHALENAQKAVEIAPAFRESQYNLAIVLVHLGRVGEAIPVLERLCEEHPGYLPGLFLLVTSYFSAGDSDSGRDTVAHLLATPLGPMLSVSFETMVEGLVKADQFQSAHRVASEAIASKCGSDSLRRTIAEIEQMKTIDLTASRSGH